MNPVSPLQITQPREGYRLTLEPFLLASFVALKGGERGIDLGTGTGVLALLLARRYSALRMVGIETQTPMVVAARRNTASNELGARVEIRHGDLRQVREFWPAESFDLAVSNPPYRKLRSGRLSPDPGKAAARHEVTMSLADLLNACRYLLRNHGKFFLVHDPSRLLELAGSCRDRGLVIKRLRFVHSRPGAPASMVLVEAVKNGRDGLNVSPPLFICEEDGGYAAEMEAVYSSLGPRAIR